MLKKLASDALGLSDIGRIISPSDYDKVDADDFIMHEDEEKIFFLIKSRTDEYCFTNLALIHVDGTSAVSKKRLVKRYDYYKNDIKHVMIETAGTVDLDCELKFTMGNVDFSIDVNRNQLEQLKDIYKAYKTHDFHGDPEMEKTIKSIGKIFQRQEMQIKAVIPER